MTINYRRAEGSVVCTYRGAKGSDVFNTKCVNDCQSYIEKTACVGLHPGTKTCGQSSSGGKNFSVCHQLEGDNGGSVDPSYSSRVSYPFQGRTLSNAPPSTLSLFRGADETIARGGSFSAGKRCGAGSRPHLISGGFLFSPLLSPQDGRPNEACHKPESPQFLGSTSTFQDGRHPYAAGDSSGGRVVSQVGLKGRVFHSPNLPGPSKVSPFCSGQNSIPVYVSPVRSILCTLGFYQGLRTSGRFPKKLRNSPYHLYRRYTGNREIPGRSSGSRGSIDCSIGGLGLHSEHGEVCNDSIPANRVPGIAGRYDHNVSKSSGSQDQSDPGRSFSAPSTGQSQCSQVGTIYREAECNIPSSISSPTFLSSPTERPPVSPTEREPELRDATPVVSGISRRDSMVAAAPFYVEWSNLAETSSAVSDSVRCLTDRVGGSVRGSSDWWSLVSRGAEVPHQLLGVDSSNSSSPGLCQGSIRNIDSLTVRQSDSRGLCQSSRWHSVAAASETGEDTLAVGSSARHYAVCPPHSRGEQSSGRCGVQGDSRSPGLEAICGSFPEDQCCLGSPGSRSICHTPLHSTRSVLQLETGSSSGSNQCFSAGLGASEGVRQPSLVPDGESSETGESSTSSSDPGGPSLERSTVVSSSSGDAVGFSSVDPLVQRPFSDDLRVSGHEFSAPAGRMAYLREKFAGQNLSNTARDLLLASWRSKSNKTYDSHFKKWLRWCTSRGSDPISGPVSEVANFLAELHREGYQSSSLNVFRSAVSSVHEKVDGVEIGKHPTITRLLKGAFHERPPLPRYVSTWDVNIVLQYLKGLGPSSDLSLKQLTYKLVMLLALTRPSRSADLSSLSLARRQFSPEGVTFLPATLAKQSRQGKPLVEFFFPSFSHDEGLCPVQTLRQYESVTFPLRLGVQQELFLAIVKPHKPVSSCTIARWLKCVLNDAGIDVNMFTAHSVRGASSSAAAMAGVTTNDILKAADWSTDSVFRRFYYRPVHSSSFGDAVLSSGCS